MTAPRVAVVISTKDRPRQIRRALASVLACDYPALSVVVVDQSPGSETLEALESWADDPRVQVFKDELPGLARGRNRGVANTNADLVAFTDDDCAVARDWPAALAATFDRCGGAAVVFGSVRTAAYDRSQGFIVGYEPPAVHCERRLRAKTRLEGIGACMAMRRSAWLALGGFDEMLGTGAPLRAGEDADMTVRALLAGYDVCEEPAAVVTHHGFRPWAEGPKVIRDYMYGLGAVYRKMLRLGRLKAARPFMELGARWLIGRPAADLNQVPPRLLRLGAFLGGFRAAGRLPLDRGTGRFEGQTREETPRLESPAKSGTTIPPGTAADRRRPPAS